MNQANKIIKLPENRCQFCKKKEATLLCDKVKGEYHIIACSRSKKTSELKHGITTCDKKICKDCATHIDGADYCPDCIEKLRKALR